MKTLWFKKGRAKIDIRPVTWQGWFILTTFIILIIYNFFRINAFSYSVSDMLFDFVPQSLLLILLYFLTANNLTGNNQK